MGDISVNVLGGPAGLSAALGDASRPDLPDAKGQMMVSSNGRKKNQKEKSPAARTGGRLTSLTQPYPGLTYLFVYLYLCTNSSALVSAGLRRGLWVFGRSALQTSNGATGKPLAAGRCCSHTP